MIISCPKCFVKYNIPPKSLGGMGRVVKCTKCAHKWHQPPPEVKQEAQKEPPAPPPQPEAPVSDAPPPITNVPALHTPGGEKNFPLWMGVLLGAGLTLGLLGLIVLLKAPLSKALPAVASIVTAHDSTAHLHARTEDTQGLVVENIQRDILEESGFTTYVITGEVTNTNMQEVTVPTLQVSLLDEQGNLLDEWRVQPQKKNLKAGEKSTWVCYFYNPPLAKISEYRVDFAPSPS